MEEKFRQCPVCGFRLDPLQRPENCPHCGSVLGGTVIGECPGLCCPVCRTNNPAGAKFCTHCGFPFAAPEHPQPQPLPPQSPVAPVQYNAPSAPAQPLSAANPRFFAVQPPAPVFTYCGIHPEDTIDGIPASEIAAFVGTKEKADYYLPRFAKMAQSGKKISWNWMSFLIFPYWALYRRMVKPAVIWMTVSLILAYAALTAMMFIAMPDLIAFARDMQEQIQNNPNYFYEGSPLFFPTSISIASGVFSLLSAAAAVLFGMFGNHLYWKFVKRRLRPAGETIPDHPAQRMMRASSLGGVKILYPFLAWGLSNVGSTVLAMLMMLVWMIQIPTLF